MEANKERRWVCAHNDPFLAMSYLFDATYQALFGSVDSSSCEAICAGTSDRMKDDKHSLRLGDGAMQTRPEWNIFRVRYYPDNEKDAYYRRVRHSPHTDISMTATGAISTTDGRLLDFFAALHTWKLCWSMSLNAAVSQSDASGVPLTIGGESFWPASLIFNRLASCEEYPTNTIDIRRAVHLALRRERVPVQSCEVPEHDSSALKWCIHSTGIRDMGLSTKKEE
jgi:hypothetical protein